MNLISLSAGRSERMDYTDKSQLVVGGETLAERTLRLFSPYGNVIRFTRDDAPDTRCTCETFMLSHRRWGLRTVILLGDVFYTAEAAREITSVLAPITFFTDRQDIFAIGFDVESGETRLLPAARAVLRSGMHNGGRLWEMYRKLMKLDDAAPLPPEGDPFIWPIADRTQDFDSWGEYQSFLEGECKNRMATA